MISQPDIIRFFADGALVLIIVIGAASLGRLFVKRPGHWRDLPVVIMAGMTALLVGKLASLAYQPSLVRPFMELGVNPGAAFIDNPGFPSDHALLGAAVVMAVVVLTRNRTVSVILLCLLLAMCAARVMALVHTPLDVLGGLTAGVIGGLWYLYLRQIQRA